MNARAVATAALTIALVGCQPEPVTAATPHLGGCNTHACDKRVIAKRKARTIEHWRTVARPHAAFLAHLIPCESASAGGYRLRTTGNGFWFAFQFTPSTWSSVAHGRRDSTGAPIGRWGGRVPRRAEQDYRAVLVLKAQGPGAWPVCGR